MRQRTPKSDSKINERQQQKTNEKKISASSLIQDLKDLALESVRVHVVTAGVRHYLGAMYP